MNYRFSSIGVDRRSPKGFHGLLTQPSPSAGMHSVPAEGKLGLLVLETPSGFSWISIGLVGQVN